MRTAGVVNTFPSLLVCFVVIWGGGAGEAFDWGGKDWGERGGGGSGCSIACVGLGFCWAAMTSSAGLGPASTS